MCSQAANGFYDLCFLSCISRFSNSWQKLHLHLSATKDKGWCATNQRGWSCQNWRQRWLCHSAEGTRYSSGQSPDHSMHSFTAVMLHILNDWFFCQVRTHSQTQRSSQDKACPGKSLFLFWHCSLEQEGTDPRTVTAGVCFWRRFKTQT